MYVIVPLAGQDLVLEDGTFRPLYNYEGEPMIKKILKNRLWIKNGEVKNKDIIFVLRQVDNLEFLISSLKKEFPECHCVILDTITRGALSTVMAGASLISDFTQPICVDLADIDYNLSVSVKNLFQSDYDLDGMLLTFEANDPKFSYLEIHGNRVTQCAEKKVISNIASTGTYFYKNLTTFLEAARGSFEASHLVSFKNSLFICPTFNFLIFKNRKVEHLHVKNIVNMSTLFHK